MSTYLFPAEPFSQGSRLSLCILLLSRLTMESTRTCILGVWVRIMYTELLVRRSCARWRPGLEPI